MTKSITFQQVLLDNTDRLNARRSMDGNSLIFSRRWAKTKRKLSLTAKIGQVHYHGNSLTKRELNRLYKNVTTGNIYYNLNTHKFENQGMDQDTFIDQVEDIAEEVRKLM